MAYEGKAQSWCLWEIERGETSALRMRLPKARSEQKRGHEAQLAHPARKLAAQTGNTLLRASASLKKPDNSQLEVQFFRMEADAMFELAKLYRTVEIWTPLMRGPRRSSSESAGRRPLL